MPTGCVKGVKKGLADDTKWIIVAVVLIILAVLGLAVMLLPKEERFDLAPEEVMISECRELNESNTIYVLEGDLQGGGSNDPCLPVTADNVTIEGNGFEVYLFGSGAQDLSGRAAGQIEELSHPGDNINAGVLAHGLDNVVVQNLAIRDYSSGVYLDSVNNGVINNSNISDVDTGIYMVNGSENKVLGSGFQNVTGNVLDINLEDSLIVRYNTIYLAELTGISVQEGLDHVIKGNIISQTDKGISLVGTVNSVVEDNLITATEDGSIVLINTQSSNIRENEVIDNLGGIAIIDGSHDKVLENTIRGSPQGGLLVWSDSRFVNVSGNELYDNGAFGFDIRLSDMNDFFSNIINGSEGIGINVFNSSYNEFGMNVINGSFEKGVLLNNSHANGFFLTTVADTNGEGIHMTGQDGINYLSFSQIKGAGRDAVLIDVFSTTIDPDSSYIFENVLASLTANEITGTEPSYRDIVADTSSTGSLQIINQEQGSYSFIDTPVVFGKIDGYDLENLESFEEWVFVGSIIFDEPLTVEGDSLQEDVVIDSNLLSIDTVGQPGFQKSATLIIGIQDLGFDYPHPLRDGELCGPSVCQNIDVDEFIGTVTFEVEQFSNYSIGQKPIEPITACRDLNDSTVVFELQEDIVDVVGTCFNVTVDDVIFAGNGSTIFGDSIGTDSGVRAEGIEGLWIDSLTVENFSRGISLVSSDYNRIENSGLRFNDHGIEVIGGTYNKIIESEIRASLADGLVLSDNTSRIDIINSSVLGSMQGSYDLSMPGGTADVTVADSEIGDYQIDTTKLIIKSTEYGMIHFIPTEQEARIEATGANLTQNVYLRHNLATVNTDVASGLNRSAEVRLLDVPEFGNPEIQRNHETCPPDNCQAISSLYGDNVEFSVTHWTNYSIFGDDITPPQVTINHPQSQTYGTSNLNFEVVLDEPGDTVLYNLNNGNNVTMNTVDNLTFTRSVTLDDGSYTFSAIANDTAGNVNDDESVSFSVDTSPPDDDDGDDGDDDGDDTGPEPESDFEVSPITVSANVIQDGSESKPIEIVNTGDNDLSVSISATGSASAYVSFNPETIPVPAGETRQVNVIFQVPEDAEVNAYAGLIKASADGIDRHVNLNLVVSDPQALFDVSVDLATPLPWQGDEVQATIIVNDVGEVGAVDVLLEYFLDAQNGARHFLDEEEIEVDGALEIERSFDIPDDLDPEETHTFVVKASYQDSRAYATSPTTPRSPVLTIILIIVTAVAGVFILLFYYSWLRNRRSVV